MGEEERIAVALEKVVAAFERTATALESLATTAQRWSQRSNPNYLGGEWPSPMRSGMKHLIDGAGLFSLPKSLHMGEPPGANGRSRGYFDREAVKDDRVIFSWKLSTRWPGMSHTIPDEVIEGFQFMDHADAAAFNLDAMVAGGRFDTWELAQRWLEKEEEKVGRDG